MFELDVIEMLLAAFGTCSVSASLPFSESHCVDAVLGIGVLRKVGAVGYFMKRRR